MLRISFPGRIAAHPLLPWICPFEPDAHGRLAAGTPFNSNRRLQLQFQPVAGVTPFSGPAQGPHFD